MSGVEDATAAVSSDRGKMLRPQVWRRPDRHVMVAISHASNDPALHRTVQIRASFDMERNGWRAHISPQDHNDQYGDWSLLLNAGDPLYATAAACLGHAVTELVSAFDGEAVAE